MERPNARALAALRPKPDNVPDEHDGLHRSEELPPLSLFNGFVTTDGKAVSFTSDNKTHAVQLVNTADVMQALSTDINYCYDVFQNPIYDPAVCSIQNAALAMTVVIRDNYFNYSDFSTYFRVGQTALAQAHRRRRLAVDHPRLHVLGAGPGC